MNNISDECPGLQDLTQPTSCSRSLTRCTGAVGTYRTNRSSFMWSRQPLPTDRKQIASKPSQDNVSGDNCNSELAGFLFQIPKKARNAPDSKCICQSGKQNEQTFQGGKPTRKKASKKIHIYSVDANVQMLRQPLKTAHLIAS